MSYVEDGEYYLRMNDFSGARKCFGYARRENQNDWRAWYGLVRVMTRNFTTPTSQNWQRFMDTARSLAPPEAVAMMNAQIGEYAEMQRILYEMQHGRYR